MATIPIRMEAFMAEKETTRFGTQATRFGMEAFKIWKE